MLPSGYIAGCLFRLLYLAAVVVLLILVIHAAL